MVAVGEIPRHQRVNADGLIPVQSPIQAERQPVLARVAGTMADVIVAIAMAVDDDVVAEPILGADPVVVRAADLDLSQHDQKGRFFQT